MRKLIPSALLLLTSTTLANGYVGAAVGESDNGLSEESTTMLEINGGFHLSRHFALEGSYLDLGEIEALGHEIGISGFTGLAVVRAPFAETLNVFAKAGLYSWSATISDEGDWHYDVVDKDVDFTYGAGVDFGVAENFSAVFEYRIVDFEDAPENARNISLGVRYNFY